MTKRLIDIEDDLLGAAKVELGTTGIADTVRSACNSLRRGQQGLGKSNGSRRAEWPRWLTGTSGTKRGVDCAIPRRHQRRCADELPGGQASGRPDHRIRCGRDHGGPRSEAFYSARSSEEFARLRDRRRSAYEYLPTDDEHWQAALEAQFQLALSGRHRSVGIADLLTAAVAKAHRLIVLHYDSDFDTAATVLDFQHRWVAKPGTL